MSEPTTPIAPDAQTTPQQLPALNPEPAAKPAAPRANRKGKALLIIFCVLALCVVAGVVTVRDKATHKTNIPVGGKPALAVGDGGNPQTADAVIEQLKKEVDPLSANGGTTLPPPGPNTTVGPHPGDPIYDPLTSPTPTPALGANPEPNSKTSTLAQNSVRDSADGLNAADTSLARGIKPVNAPGAGRNNQSSFYLHGYGFSQETAEPAATPDAVAPVAAATPDAPVAAPIPKQDDARAGEAGAAKPPLGAMLPVRLLGALYTFRAGGLARLQLTRPVQGNGWLLPRGTVFVCRLDEGQKDRAFLSLLGYLEPDGERLIPLGGEVLGTDGAPGLKGEQRAVGRRWTQALSQLSAAGVQLGSAYLLGRNGGGFYGLPPAGSVLPSRSVSQPGYVVVAAGVTGFIMVTDLPPTATGAEQLGAASRNAGGENLPDEELALLISEGSSAQIRAALPRMSPPLRAVAQRVLAQEK
jgi:hypothetical protein